MRFYKFISVILHPIVVPTIGVMLYFLLIPNNFESKQRINILSLIFVVTYLIPLLILVIFKRLRIIETYQTESIKERKLPLALMITLFYVLGNTLDSVINLRDLGLLFYATSLGLFIIYILFYFQIRASIHLLSIGIAIGFFIVLGTIYSQSFIIIIIALFLIAGLLASARLKLNAHTSKEVYIGFFIGFLSPLSMYYIL
ncbi:hypothetical protein SAMN05216503_0259 [Polaribacter sp. KT25b]|uniref:hypothetical protein n=1 Tax=Polaribacter sp. KT25b TaxID=1855336 RepID=UPI00087AC460|nr:hypothetical protein [Polaribacter sp. KT25b]SDR67262.1 hypothetical protein SAMN05216503_0259 [Polaribacter sp. KT25b]